ncbi:MAG: TonB-dependent receptor [Gammaproteobacteria bacterium]
MNYRKTVISAGVVAAFCVANAAIAQDPATLGGGHSQHQDSTAVAQDTDQSNQDSSNIQNSSDTQTDNKSTEEKAKAKKTVELSSVSVVGIRASLAASLETKRNADAIVDAVTAEDVGKFPTTNVAEALALIPGVTLDKSMPATQRVSVDGLDPSLNVSLLDGHPVAQAMWLFGDSPNRGFNFSLLPAELIGKVEVFKSPEARLTEGSLGGLIVMHTLEPLDVKSNTVSGSVSYNYNSLVSQGKPNASLFYSLKNNDSTFGFDISAQHYEQIVSRQGMENYGYTPISAIAAQNPAIQAEVNAGTLKPTDLMPNQLSAANFNQVERRNDVFANIQFKPTDNFGSTVSLMYMVDDLANTNQSTYAWASLRPGGITQLGNVVNGIVTTGSSVNTGPMCTKPDGNCGQQAISLSDNFARESEITTKGIDWRTNYNTYDWNVSTQLGVSDSTNPITQVLKELAYGGSFNWNLNKGFTFTDPATANNPNDWADYGWGGNHSLLPYSARDTYGQIDFSHDLNGFFNDLLFGVRYAGHWESQAEYVYGGFQPVTLAQLGYGGLTDLSGLSDLGLSSSMVQHVQTGGFGAIAGANPLSATTNYPNNPDANSYWDNTWNVVQENTAAYVQGNFAQGDMHGNLGARIVRTQIRSQGFDVPGGCAASDSFTCTFPKGFGWTTHTSTHTDVLPAFNIAYDVTHDVVLRGAASETVAYAPYNQLAPYFEANDTVLTATAGNPDLSPYKSENFDGSAEWYFAPQSVLAGSLFYKDVTNYIVNQATVQQRINGSWTLPGYQNSTGMAQVAAGNCTAAGVCKYSVTQPVDGGHATVKGFAVSYQQAFGDTPFGLRANYTYSDATTSGGGDMPYNSKNSYSISPYFEQGPFSASIAYNWRGSYLAGGYVAGAPSTYIDSYKDLSASASYAINDQLSVNFSALNLLNSTYYAYLGSTTQLAEEYKTGRQYLLTLRFKY